MSNALVERSLKRSNLDRVRCTMTSGIATMNYEVSDYRLAPETSLEGIRLGSLDVMRYQGRGTHRGERRRQHIIDDASDHFVVCVPSNARCGLRQAGSSRDYEPGTLVFVSMLHPWQAYITGEGPDADFSAICVRVPGPLLRQRMPQIDLICNRSIHVTTGVGHIMRSLFEMSLVDGPFLQPSDTEVLGNTLIDLMVNAARQACSEEHWQLANTTTSLSNVVLEAKRFIEANLSNPALDASTVALHCRVSVRYLHAAFASLSTSAASYIRESRLIRCREALRCPELDARSITEIAGAWGFTDSSSFSRTYKRHFGIAPQHDRKHMESRRQTVLVN